MKTDLALGGVLPAGKATLAPRSGDTWAVASGKKPEVPESHTGEWF